MRFEHPTLGALHWMSSTESQARISVWELLLGVKVVGLRDAQRAGKHYVWLCLLRVFLEEISIWVNRLNEEGHPHHCRWASCSSRRAWIEQKGGGRANSFSPGAGTAAVFSCPQILVLPILQPYTTNLLVPQLANGRSWDFLASENPCDNSCSKYLSQSLSLTHTHSHTFMSAWSNSLQSDRIDKIITNPNIKRKLWLFRCCGVNALKSRLHLRPTGSHGRGRHCSWV